MTITETIKGAFKLKTPEPAQIARRIADQEALVRELEQCHAEASLAWASSAAGSSTALDQLDAQLGTARRELRALQAAHALAVEQKTAEERARVAALHATQIRACEQHLAARDKAAVELTKALTLVAAHYKTLIARSEKARNACPIGMAWPMGSLCELGPIKRQIAIEMFRLMGDPSLNGAATFPGADPGDLRFLTKPDAMEPLTDVIERASRHTLDVLKGKKPAEVGVRAPVAATPSDSPSAAEELATLRTGPKTDARSFVPTRSKLT
jgi:hypothetical protein